MPASLTDILFIVLLILANGVFAMSEIAVISARKARLQQRSDNGDLRARAALELANHPGHFLATVQIGITLVGILAGAFGGATIAEELAEWLRTIPLLAPYSDAIGLGIVVVTIAYLSLILGELVPKRLALNNPERIASAVAGPMRRLSLLALPAVRLLSASADAVLRVLRARASTEPPITEEEINLLIAQGTQAGMFEEAEQEMVEGVFRLGGQRVVALMTPRAKMVWLEIGDSPDEIRRKISGSTLSSFPVCRGGLDNILGVVQVKDLLSRSLAGQPVDLSATLQQPPFVPEGMPALKVLELFKETGMPIALVMDEHGGFEGLVTVRDFLEAIAGDVSRAGEPGAVQREDGSWLVDGLMQADEFKGLLRLEQLPGEEGGSYRTVGGFVMSFLGRIPHAGDHFEWGSLRVEVLDMDGRRVDKVLVAPIRSESPTLSG